MGKTSLKKLQQAIYTKLTNSSQLMAIISGVFDIDVPTTTTPPYITMGEITENNFHTFERSGRDISFTFHVWSEHDGFSECFDILDIVNSLLDYQEITINNFDLVYGRFETSQTLREPDGETFHLVIHYKFLVQEVL